MNPTNLPLTLIAPSCTCCPEPQSLLARDDLAAGLVVCEKSGQLYRSDNDGQYRPAVMPDRSVSRDQAPSVQIDLSQSGYA